MSATPIGHVRFRAWRIGVTRHHTDLGGLTLWLDVRRLGVGAVEVTVAEPFGVVRIDDRGRTVHLSTGAAGLHLQSHSATAAAIAARALQIHLSTPSGYTVAEVDPDRIDAAGAAEALEAATRTVLAAHGDTAV
jgi:hypothetical protein